MRETNVELTDEISVETQVNQSFLRAKNILSQQASPKIVREDNKAIRNGKLFTKYKDSVVEIYNSRRLELDLKERLAKELVDRKKLRSIVREAAAAKSKAVTPKQEAQEEKPQSQAQKKEKESDKPSTAMIKKMFGTDVDNVLSQSPTIEHPSRVFMSSLMGTMEPCEGMKVKNGD